MRSKNSFYNNFMPVFLVLSALFVGYSLSHVIKGIPSYCDNFQNWYNSPPSYLTELSTTLCDSLDEDSWTIIRSAYDKSMTGNITNGVIEIHCCRPTDDKRYDVFCIFKVGDQHITDALSVDERKYLIKKARKLYKQLEYAEALRAIKEIKK